MNTDDLLLVGRVARPHGIRGQVVVNPDTDFVNERFIVGQVLLIGAQASPEPREIQEVRFHQGRPILSLAGIESMDAAELLAGKDVWLPLASLGPLPDGVFYRHDLVGCEVLDTKDAIIGRVTAVEGTLERSHLVIDGQVMIPMVEEICLTIDLAARRVIVNPPEGLIEIYRLRL